jgi:hypothetical protein
MSSPMMDLNLAAQANLLSAMDTSQAYVIESVKAWAATSKRLLPDLPGMPEVTSMVDPLGTVSTTYDFAEKVLASQRSFVEEMMTALTPAGASS